MKKRLLWVGDAECQSGFARCTHSTLETLRETFDIAVMGVNYRGDPHDWPYPIWPAMPGGMGHSPDPLGYRRIEKLVQHIQPDVIVIQNDPWNIPRYVEQLPAKLPLIGVIAVDGKNVLGNYLRGLDLAVFWTEFGRTEAVAGGYGGPSTVIPLGVDLDLWSPGNRNDARKFLFEKDYEALKNAFIFVNVNRNQPRKRLDLTIRYFSQWVHRNSIEDAYLYIHVAPTGDGGYNCEQLAKYYGVENRLIFAEMGVWKGVSDETLREIYRASNVCLTTTQGEGWGLPTMEAMACGLPVLYPSAAALQEWVGTAGHAVPCSSSIATAHTNTIGGIADEETFIEGLHELYCDADLRDEYTKRGLALVQRPEYRWNAIGERFVDEILNTMDKKVSKD